MADRGEAGVNLKCAPLPFSPVAEHTMVMPSSARVWTAAEVREMQDEFRPWPRFELIDGELLVTPSPRRIHQRAVLQLYRTLYPYVDRHGIGEVELSPADIELVPETIVQPDVFVSPLVDGRVSLDWGDTKSLLLAAEVVSPSNARNDRVTKRRFFMRVAVAEYWVVDTDARIIERNRAGVEGVEILDRTLTWAPAGAPEAFVLDLVAFFATVHGEERK